MSSNSIQTEKRHQDDIKTSAGHHKWYTQPSSRPPEFFGWFQDPWGCGATSYEVCMNKRVLPLAVASVPGGQTSSPGPFAAQSCLTLPLQRGPEGLCPGVPSPCLKAAFSPVPVPSLDMTVSAEEWDTKHSARLLLARLEVIWEITAFNFSSLFAIPCLMGACPSAHKLKWPRRMCCPLPAQQWQMGLQERGSWPDELEKDHVCDRHTKTVSASTHYATPCLPLQRRPPLA